MLITFCRIDTHTSYSMTERGRVGDNSMWMNVKTDVTTECGNMHDPAWHDVGMTHDLRQRPDASPRKLRLTL